MPNTTDTNSSTTPTPASPTNYIAAIDHNVAVGQVQPIQSPTSNANAKANVFGIKDWSPYSVGVKEMVEYYSAQKNLLQRSDSSLDNLTAYFTETGDALNRILIQASADSAFRKAYSLQYNEERDTLLNFYTARLSTHPPNKNNGHLKTLLDDLKDKNQNMTKPLDTKITGIPQLQKEDPDQAIPEGNKSKHLKRLSYGLFTLGAASGAAAAVGQAAPIAIGKVATTVLIATSATSFTAGGGTAIGSKFVEKTEKNKVMASSPKL